MLAFDDFDAWSAAISGADLRLFCDRIEERRWELTAAAVGDVFLQVAREGGGNLCYGGINFDATVLFIPLDHFGTQAANGETLGEDAVLALPPGSDFRISVRQRAHGWCSVALPGHHTAGRASEVLRPGVAAVSRLRRLVRQVAKSPVTDGGSGPAHQAAAQEIIDAATRCLAGPSTRGPTTGRPKADRGEIIRRTMAYLDSSAAGRPSVATLAAHAGVNERLLCRAFRDSYGVCPIDYVWLRLLHRVRRALCDADPGRTTVTQVLVEHGIWEHGRFAGRYRRHFGESPAETLRRE